MYKAQTEDEKEKKSKFYFHTYIWHFAVPFMKDNGGNNDEDEKYKEALYAVTLFCIISNIW